MSILLNAFHRTFTVTGHGPARLFFHIDARFHTGMTKETPFAEIVTYWIERHGEDAPAELQRRAAAERRAGNKERAANFIELAKAVQAELLSKPEGDD